MLDRLNLSAVRAVALDVDGTLAGADSKVSPRTIAAMKRVQELGIPVILLTGRTRRNTMAIARRASLRSFAVACNGALIIDPVTDSNVAVNPMSAPDKATFRQLADDLRLDLTWWTENHMYVTGRGDMYDLILELNHEEALVGDPDDITDAVAMKMMAMSSVERMDEVQDEILHRMPTAMRSLDNLVEVVDPDSTKWHGLEWALERYGVDPASVLGAGDGGNDVVWLSRIGFPVAMGNARDEVRQVTVAEGLSNADEGAADLLERVAAAHGVAA